MKFKLILLLIILLILISQKFFNNYPHKESLTYLGIDNIFTFNKPIEKISIKNLTNNLYELENDKIRINISRISGLVGLESKSKPGNIINGNDSIGIFSPYGANKSQFSLLNRTTTSNYMIYNESDYRITFRLFNSFEYQGNPFLLTVDYILISQKNYVIAKVEIYNNGSHPVNFTEIYQYINFNLLKSHENFVMLPLITGNEIIQTESKYSGNQFNQSFILYGSNYSHYSNCELYSAILIEDINSTYEINVGYPISLPNRMDIKNRPLIVNTSYTNDVATALSWNKTKLIPGENYIIIYGLCVGESQETIINSAKEFLEVAKINGPSTFYFRQLNQGEKLVKFLVTSDYHIFNDNVSLRIMDPYGNQFPVNLYFVDEKTWNGSFSINRDGIYIFFWGGINIGGFIINYYEFIYISTYSIPIEIGYIILVIEFVFFAALFILVKKGKIKKVVK